MIHTKADVHRAVFRIIEDRTRMKADLTGSCTLSDLGLDSLDRIETEMDIEEALDVTLPPEFVRSGETVQGLIDRLFDVLQAQRNSGRRPKGKRGQ